MTRRGFSLIEVIVVVAIAASLVFVVSSLSGNVSGLNTLVSQQLQSKSDIDQTLQIMTTEVRSAGPSGSGAFPVDVAGTSTFGFYTDIGKNGTVEHVRYFLATSTIYKGVTNPTGSPATYPSSTEVVTDLIDNVIIATGTTLFNYYGTTYTGTQAPLAQPVDLSQIRLVKIGFNANVNPSQNAGLQYFGTFVDIRNLRSN